MTATNIAAIVAAALDGASEAHLEDIASHGIHNITNEYHSDNDEEYEAFAAEFKSQAKAALIDLARYERDNPA
jgi:predicted nicotinamide N-methyase